ncbi:Dihydroxy-acid dehydratase [Blautia hydrogenotrophica]|uniref:dihydroxy-acid dehydratase n=1 Tax=Blautia hydrogenotrophica TaxID=53443 RepID=UPI0006C0BA29|nr:dihydroxy-acid dehydratase [Blautia hydrogenotrophica]CUN07341.1 Dihydroxy-acid dehydratase [Blautia hydrogenotrophica]SCI05068.1 Dihydroxy-acid dehydratase [uncultured Blautia sp.]
MEKDRGFKSKYFNGQKAAHRRAVYKGCGYDPEDMNKPHIGIANTFSEASPGHAHFRPLVEAVKAGIWEAGGIPFEFGVPSTCGNIAIGTNCLRYEMAVRDVVCSSIEIVSKIQLFDGVVMTCGCDNIVPGTLMAAARLDIPSLLLTAGPMLAGNRKGKELVLSDVNERVFGRAAAKKEGNSQELLEMEQKACASFGACPVMGTANTMQIIAEAMGMTLPGTSVIPGVVTDKFVSARKTGRQIVEMVKNDRRVSSIITEGALKNAIMADLAIGGSTNAVLHILSIAKELELPVTLQDFDELSRRTPTITNLRPAGEYTVDKLYLAGGVPAILKQLENLINTQAQVCTGQTWEEILREVSKKPNLIVHSVESPICEDGGLAVLKGNLAERGAIIRTAAVKENMRHFKGPARVYDSDEEAFEALISGKIYAGDVIVIRYAGPRGAPGLVEVMLTADALVDLGLDTSVGLVTDGRFSGFNYGPIVGHVSPEASEGGMIAYVRDGDMIEVDIPNRTLRVDVGEEELDRRKQTTKLKETDVRAGILKLYANNSLSSDEGAAMQRWN